MLQSRLYEGIGSALYLCPNKFLVDQTCLQAQRFGIPVTNGNAVDDLPPAFLNGKEIYVCTIQKLFNGLTRFGLKADSIPLGTVMMDDCHACIDSIKQACSITLKAGTTAYNELLQLFASDLRDQGAGTFGDIQGGEYDALLPVPYWAWIDRRDEVTTILGRNRQDDSIKFVWPVLRDMLDKCCCVVSGSWMEISPYISPLQQFGSFYNAKYRIFMSATVTDDSFLVKGLRLSADTISKPITYPKEKWFGEKMILIPSLIDSETGREKVVTAWQSLWKTANMESSGYVRAKRRRNCGAMQVQMLPNEAILSMLSNGCSTGNMTRPLRVNRYDGIDLPDKHCRILILDSKPFSGGLIDRHTESCRPSSEVTAQRMARMIEQGIGRGVRGEKDYCAVILVGGDLVRAVQRNAVKKFYSSQTRKQIEIGIEIAQISEDDIQHGLPGLSVILDCVKKLLNRDAGWKDYYADRMSEVTLEKPNQEMLNLYAVELQAETKAEEGRMSRPAISSRPCSTRPRKCPRRTGDGTHKRWLDSSTDTARWNRQRLQNAAHKKNRYLLKPKEGMVFKKLEPLSQQRVANIIKWVQKSKDFQDLMMRVHAILGDLRFGVEADTFEQAFDDLGQALGFAAERPDKEWGQGPDNLWCLKSDQYLLVECKNQVKGDREEIAKAETGQMNNSFAWFTEKYPGANVVCVMVVPTKKVGQAAGFNMDVTVIRESNLKKLGRNVQKFFQEFSAADFMDLDQKTVQRWLTAHDLETDQIVRNYTEAVQK